jgi:DNA-binding transcriptional regulator YhcF (GntR family)
MDWALNKKNPLCPQIYEQICVSIAKGEFQPDERLMSVREVAVAAGVNPNTVQKAFEALEQAGILYSVRGSGWFAGEDTAKAKAVLKKIIDQKTAAYFKGMESLGLSLEAAKQYIKEWNQ